MTLFVSFSTRIHKFFNNFQVKLGELIQFKIAHEYESQLGDIKLLCKGNFSLQRRFLFN